MTMDTWVNLVSDNRNRGKGYALKKGVFFAKKKWLLTMDIDLSVNLNQLNIWKRKKYLKKDIFVYFGSRLLNSSKVNAKKYRAFTGKIFNLILSLVFDRRELNIKDTQCGFKLYKSIVAKKIFNKSKEDGYIQDVEILLLLLKKRTKIKELPVIWSHKSGSKVNILTDSIYMFYNLIKLKFRLS